MEIRYTPAAKDYAAFQSYVLRHGSTARGKAGGWKARLAGAAFCAALIALGLVFLEDLAALNVTDTVLSVLFAALGILVLMILLQLHFFRRLARSLPGRVTLRITEEGLQHDDTRTLAITRWSGIDHIGRTDNHIMILLGYCQGYAIPRSAFPNDDAFGTALRALKRYGPAEDLEPAGRKAPKPGRGRRWALAGSAVAALLLLSVYTAPWRSTLALPDGLGEVDYLVTTTGGADPEARLPLIVDLHGLGGLPEVLLAVGGKRSFPARVVYPAAAQRRLIGHSWFALDENMARDARAEAARLAAFTRLIMARYPTAGRPIVTGFSQGGDMAFQMAARHPELFVAAVPVAAEMPDALPDYPAPPRIVVRALHGGADQLVPVAQARGAIDHLRARGWDAELQVFPEAGHRLPGEAAQAWRALLADLAAEQARQQQVGAR